MNCVTLYFTGIDPNGITLFRIMDKLKVQEDIPKLSVKGLPLTHLSYTVDGFYTFMFTYFFGVFPHQRFGSFRIMLTQKEARHE